MNWFTRWFKSAANPTFIATTCGHETMLMGKVSAFGTSIRTTMPKNSAGSTDYCLDCIGKMAIQCAWCGEPIFIGDPITLYTPVSEKSFQRTWTDQQEFEFVAVDDLGFKIPSHAVVHQRSPLQLVGCLRFDCAKTGADRAGFWVPGSNGKGRVFRVKTAYEEILGGKDIVITDNLGDMSKADPHQETSADIPVVRNIR